MDAVLHRGVRYDTDQTARTVGAIDFAAFKGAFLHQASPGQETDQTAHIAVVPIYSIFVHIALNAAAVGTVADLGIEGCRRGDTAHDLSSYKAAQADIAVFYRTAVQKCRYTSDESITLDLTGELQIFDRTVNGAEQAGEPFACIDIQT